MVAPSRRTMISEIAVRRMRLRVAAVAAGCDQARSRSALRMLRRGDIKGRQVCPGAPWVIRAADLAGFATGKRTKAPEELEAALGMRLGQHSQHAPTKQA